jgi:hypothetical protein
MSSQYYKATAYVGTPHRNEVEVTIPLVGPQGPAGEAGAGAVESVNGQTGVVVLAADDVGAAQAVTNIELTVNGTTTITTAQLPARGIALCDGQCEFTVNLPTPDINQSGLTFSIKSFYESTPAAGFITVVHNASDLLTSYELNEDESSLDFLWDGYRWTYSSANWLYSYPNRRLAIPALSGTLGLSEPSDTTFRVVGSSDATKKVAFEVDGLTTATTRTLTVPNASGTLALLETLPAELVIACSDETSNLTTGTAKVTFRMPYAMTLSSVRASVNTAPTGSTLIVDINEAGSTILSTKLSIDASELTSATAATAAVISDTALADDAEITIDIDQIGSTIAGKGLKVVLKGVRA